MKAANGARKLFLTVLTPVTVLGLVTLAVLDPAVFAGPPKPDYSLSASSDTVTQPSGSDPAPLAQFSITLVPGAAGYTDPVTLSYKDLPKGVTNVQWSDDSATINTAPDNRSIDLSFNVPGSLKVGTYTFTVTGKNSAGKDARDVKVTLGVGAPVSGGTGFSVTLDPTARTIPQGTSTTYAVQLLPTASFSGSVTLTTKGLPGGTTGAFSSPTVAKASPSSTLTITTSAKTHAGVFHFTVEGTSGKSHVDVVAQLTVQAPAGSGYTLALSPSQQQVAAGGVTTFALGIARSPAFTGVPITLNTTGLPVGADATFDVANPTSGDTATITISTDEITTPDGNFEFTVTGTSTAPAFSASIKGHLVVKTPPGKTFGVTSTGAGTLAPGAGSKKVDLALTNPNDKPILITNLSVSFGSVDPDHAGCTAADYSIVGYSGGYPIRIEKKASATLSGLGIPDSQWPTVQLINRPVNQDACKGATLTLAYSGNAREAG